MTRPFDIEDGLAVAAQARATGDELMAETARIADVIADGFRADFDTTLDMETVGKALVIAAASVTRLAADKRGVPATVVVNMIGLAGENLVRTARARAAEQAGEVEGVLCEHVLTWHRVDAPDDDPGVEIPLYQHITLPDGIGELRSHDREVDEPESDEDVWCPHPECHDRLHGDSVHADERGRPFTGPKPTDPLEWTEKPGA